jgi:hypothetical protein
MIKKNVFQSQTHKQHTEAESFKDAASEVRRAAMMTDSDGLRQLKYKLVNLFLFSGANRMEVI